MKKVHIYLLLLLWLIHRIFTILHRIGEAAFQVGTRSLRCIQIQIYSANKFVCCSQIENEMENTIYWQARVLKCVQLLHANFVCYGFFFCLSFMFLSLPINTLENIILKFTSTQKNRSIQYISILTGLGSLIWLISVIDLFYLNQNK